MKFGELIRSRREEAKLSLQEVGDACSISKAHVWEMEKGNSINPSFMTVIRLSLCLGIPINLLAAAILEEK